LYGDQPPVFSYRAYETSVAEALHKSALAREARPRPQPHGDIWLRLRAGVAALRDYVERRLQPAEEGYLA
jgi:hypothetical protein